MMSQVLRWIGHQIPNIRYVRAIPNRILKPLHEVFGLGGGVVDVLGFAMRLDPHECVDGGLWFAPHLYDRAEIGFLLHRFPTQGIFLDVGANIGFWSLRFAHAFPRANIFAIEANQATFQVLRENIQINDFRNITPVHVGVSDEFGKLPLYCNDTGNRGGDSFVFGVAGRNRSTVVPVKPLAAILADAGLVSVDVMKMDIEGFEERVLTRFFLEAPRSLWPRFICAEILHVPQVAALLQNTGYRLVLTARENSVFALEHEVAMLYRFTVFTPTYNRAHTLRRVYESLKHQTFRDFEWLIVDDGSTDNTRELVEIWQRENPFPIRYFWQDNAHKKAAFNRGVKEAKGEFFLPFDSDDEALPNALDILNWHWCNIPAAERDGFSSLIGLCINSEGVVVGSRFPANVFDSDSLAIRHRYRVEGEKWGFQRTDVLRQFPFPEDVQGLVPEGVVWSAIASRYKTRFVNDVLRIYYTEANSITQASAEKNADGLALWAREVLCSEWRWLRYNPKWFLKMAANYTRFHLHLQKSQPGKHWDLRGFVPRLLVALMWPVGMLRYWLDVRKAAHG